MTTDMFDELFAIAKAEIADLDEKAEGMPALQVTVLLTYSNHFYVAVNDVDGTICEKMKQTNDTRVIKVLTMWKDGSIDLPSFDFRDALIQMDERNLNAEMILNGMGGYHTKTLAVSMPPVQK